MDEYSILIYFLHYFHIINHSEIFLEYKLPSKSRAGGTGQVGQAGA